MSKVLKYGYEKLNVGESLIIPKSKVKFRGKFRANSVSSAASEYGRNHNKIFMSKRRNDDSVLICRVV